MSETTRSFKIPNSGQLKNWLGIGAILVGLLVGYVRLMDQVDHNHEDAEEVKATIALMQIQLKEANDSAIAQRQRRICARDPGAC